MRFGAQDESVAFLAAQDGGIEKIIATHISVVLLGATRAYKLKRAVSFPFLDFSTPQLRAQMCARELRLNAPLASGLYLGVARITREKDGALAMDGAGELVDAVVVMRRFADDALFDKMAQDGALTKPLIETLARKIAQAHGQTEPDLATGASAAMRKALEATLANLVAAAPAPADEIDAHAAQLRAALEAQADLLDARKAKGAVRACHGDLTLRNICLHNGEPTPFDCLEFSDELATIDVFYDLAFLLMDLLRVGAHDLANLALNRYLDARDESDALPALPLFLSLRATIRAHVEATQGHTALGRAYFDLARRLLEPPRSGVIAIGGLSGAGKSSVAAALAPRLGSVGARILNSDRIRKKLFGAQPTDRLPKAAYASDVSERVYREMFEEAARVAQTGWPVIVDAVFDRPQDRDAIARVAQTAGAPFFGLWLDVDLARRVGRVENRRNDVSDATPDVLRMQMEKATGAIDWTRIDAAQDIATIIAAAEAARAL